MTVPLLLILLAAASTAPQEVSPAAKTAERVAVPEPSPRAMDYYESGNELWIFARATEIAIPALVLLTGLSVRIRMMAQRIGRKWFFVILVYFVLYSLLQFALLFPLDFYAGYLRPHEYGLSNQTFMKWLCNVLVSGAIGLAFGGLLIWLPYLLIHRSPRRWWLYTAIVALPVMFFVALVEPIWVDPLFNHFGPMKDKRLEAQILVLADEAGIENGRVFEVDKSVDTNAVNAYVTGLGNSKRIVLWDTLLAKHDAREVRAVVAHEMGHYVLNHVLKGLAAGFCGLIIALYLVYRGANFLMARCKDRFGFQQLSDVASLPLLLLVAQIVVFLMMPIGLAFSRHQEHEADRFALELTHDNRAMALDFVRFQEENLGNPHPGILFAIFRATHPSLGERIEFANDYRPWEKGEPSVYGGLFKTTREQAAKTSGEAPPSEAARQSTTRP